MAAGQAFKFFIKVGKQILGTNSKKVAEELAKQGGKRIPKNKVPDGATVKKAPTVPNPRTSKGTYTRPQPPAARPNATAPARPSAPKSTSPAKPKVNKTPATNTKKPSVPSKVPGGTRGRFTGGRGRKKAPLMPKNMVRERPNLPPKPLTNRPALLRDSARPEAPEIDKDSIRDTTKRGPSTRTSPKAPKKQQGPSKRGKPAKRTAAPKGPMSLREYLNAEIKKRGSSVTKEKKGAEKYSSIAAAKRAGSLYYKNSKTGKIMAAVYKEDLKR